MSSSFISLCILTIKGVGQSRVPDYVVETLDLTRKFKGKKKEDGGRFLGRLRSSTKEIVAVDHLNIRIKKGELFGLLGPNGAGKTTTIKMLATLLIPDEGTAKVNGYDVVSEADEVRRCINMVAGGGRAFYMRLSGRENLWYFSQIYGVPEEVAKKRIEELLDLIELTDRADDRVEKYSSGMIQRLHIARGLINDPQILLLDEPTLGLDPNAAHKIRNYIREEIVNKLGKTVLLTTHYMLEADQLCDRVAIIHKGKIIALDTPDNMKRSIAKESLIELEITNLHQDIIDQLRGIESINHVLSTYRDPTTGDGTPHTCPQHRTSSPPHN